MKIAGFRLDERVGEGAMGEVWIGSHVRTQHPVAIKLFKGHREDFLLNEVRAMARLEHPNLAWIYDFGHLDVDTGRFRSGTPWFVMERASGGTLGDLREPLEWQDNVALISTLLQALGHAHARGVVHRDIKPANILLCTALDPRPGMKIADFGVARALESTERSIAAGSPPFMAPEQVLGEWRRQGPWTDLYSLACVIWWLVTGHLLFRNLAGAALLRAHIFTEPPAFEPVIDVPPGFEIWLRSLLAKHPADRFRSASDALLALSELGAPEPFSRRRARRLHPEDAPTTRTPVLQGVLRRARPRPSRSARASSWRRPAAAVPFPLLGVGANLVGVRRAPLVGRESERTALWNALRWVQNGSPALVVLEGPMGVGKTRLARWLSERAHETGSADTFWIQGASGGNALLDAWRQTLRLHGLTGEARRKRIEEALGDTGCEDARIADAVDSILDPDSSSSSGTRFGVLTRLMVLRCAERPQLLVIDAAETAFEALTWVEYLRNGVQLPLLIVVTAQTESLREREAERRLLASLMQHPGRSEHLQIAALSTVHSTALVRQLLGVAPRAQAAVLERTAGNPMHTIQLVGDWLERGILAPGANGVDLRKHPGPRYRVERIWASRLATVFEGLDPRAALYMERAAIGGHQVKLLPWARACDVGDPQGERCRAAVVERLADAGLIEKTPSGFQFAHALIRQALIERAHQGGRTAEHHLACAGQLDPDNDAHKARLGMHMLEAGQHEQAFEMLLAGSPRHGLTQGYHARLALLERCVVALKSLPDNDRRWARLWSERAAAYLDIGDLEAGLQDVERAQPIAERLPDMPLLAEILRIRTMIGWYQGTEGWKAHIFRALEVVEDAPHDLLGALHWVVCAIAMDTEDLPLLRTHAPLVANHLRQSPRQHEHAEAERMLGYLARHEERLEDAEQHFQKARDLYETCGTLAGIAYCTAELAHLAFRRDELGLAGQGYRAAMELFDLVGHLEGNSFRLLTGMVLLLQGNSAEGWAMVEPVHKPSSPESKHIHTLVFAAFHATLGHPEALQLILEDLEAQPFHAWIFHDRLLRYIEHTCEQRGDHSIAARFRRLTPPGT